MVWHTIWNVPGMLFGAVQELHRCLASLLKKGNLLDITMLDVAEKDPVTPSVPKKKGPHHGSRNQNPGKKSQLPYLLPTYRKLQSQKELPTQKNYPSCRGDCHQHPLDSPVHGQMSLAHPPTGSGLTGQYTPGGLARPKLLGVQAGNSIP